jgi:3-keto-disaccharide hydrolase
MKRTWIVAVFLAMASAASAAETPAVPEGGYEVHDKRRPQPLAVTPPMPSTQDQAGKPPSDAVVLFDGSDLSKWSAGVPFDATNPAKWITDKNAAKEKPAPWKVVDGVIEVAPKTGYIQSKDEFADCQVHVEWCEPQGLTAKSQGRGNSGVFLMGLYEVQVLDNYQSETYADGSAGGVYGQYPPLVNAVRPPGQWQCYDIVFHPPVYEGEKVVKPARETVFLNGLLVQDDVELIGPTQHQQLTSYPTTLPSRGPLALQDHGNPIRFRNIWVRSIPADKPPVSAKSAGENYYEKH